MEEKKAAKQWVTLNVGGTTFKTQSSTLQRYPETLLGGLTTSSEHYKEDIDEYVFDRNPILVPYILDFYRSGHLHFPTNQCGSSIQDDIKFWQIKETNISPCCWSNYLRESDQEEVLKFDSEFDTVDRYENESGSNGICSKEKLWLLLEDSASSCGAKVKAALYIILICLSIMLLVLETMPKFRRYKDDTKNEEASPNSGFYFAEFFISGLFALELVLRFVVSPNKKKFLLNFFNILNLAIILSQICAFALVLDGNYDRLGKACWLLSCVRIFRVLLVYKIARHFTSMRVLGLALKNSTKELLWILLFYILSVFFFAIVLYTVETGPDFTIVSITEAAYWAIITMTTVGYGDIIPRSPLGQITCGVCALVGIMFMVVTMAVVVVNFNKYNRLAALKNSMSENKKAKRPEDKAASLV